MYIFFGIFIIIALLCFVFNYRRKKSIIKKVCSIPKSERICLLNDMIKPMGYQYLPSQDIFFTTLDAWQRNFGFTRSYDCAAPFLGMVYDSEPVYFDFEDRTWMVELWKGQYGINTGAEIGIYCADGIVPPKNRRTKLFYAVSDEELPQFTMCLKRTSNRQEKSVANISMPHWWLAAFRVGCFSEPDNLNADFCINFNNCEMTQEFANALIELGYDACSLKKCGSGICFCFDSPKSPVPCGFLTKCMRRLAQLKNRIYCKLYLRITRPFCCTYDRLIYLYFYLPFAFRRCMRLRRYKKRPHKKCKNKKACRNVRCRRNCK